MSSRTLSSILWRFSSSWGGFVWLLVDAYREAKITVRKKVVVIEGRALRKVATTLLHKTVSRYFNGKIDALTLDMTQRM
ncbi:hypothetical protein [Serratia marcescens]|uniref:hypothetical protein n=1 Tax=Serratia marcescens TaxID=615 RepID=UPI0020C9474F|nr:hypothetical protein [Serratia marcescens]MDY7605635.1 hypothetical protein [Serratia marcescens]